MYILVKLINKIYSLIYSLFKKSTNNITYKLQLMWGYIFEKTLEFLIEKKIIYFVKLKRIENFTKLFKKIEIKLLFSINRLFNYNIIHKSPSLKSMYVIFFFNYESFKKYLIWLPIKKFYFLQKKSQFNKLFEAKYISKITCIYCSAKIYINELFYCSDLFFYPFNQRLVKIYYLKNQNCAIIVSNHVCIFCKTNSKTYHELYLSKIPIYWYNATYSLSITNQCVVLNMLLFIVSSSFLFYNKNKKNFKRQFNFKHINLLIIKDSNLNLLPFMLKLNNYPIFNLNTHSSFFHKKTISNEECLQILDTNKTFDFKINMVVRNAKYPNQNLSVESNLFDKFIDKLNKLKIYNKLNIKFLLGKPKNLDLILNFFYFNKL
jgi:hypothetical protein